MSDPTNYQVNITMSGDTVIALQQNNYQLYGFKAVDGPASAVPVIWFSTNDFSATTKILWSEQYAGYTASSSALAPMTEVQASFSAPMSLGQIMDVGIGGIGTVANDGTPGELSILNTVTTPYTCGVSVLNTTTNESNPICAFPLFGNGLDTFVPVEVVYLTFATQSLNTGTVIEQTFAQGVTIDMTGQTAPVNVTFDINNGWTGPGILTVYPPTADLKKLLVNPGGPQATSFRAGQRRRLLLGRAA
jgi:hypothetical protein